jgi:hypothetical protein
MLSVIYTECHLCLVSFMLSFIYAECHAECHKQAHYAECHYAECRSVIPSVVVLNVMAPSLFPESILELTESEPNDALGLILQPSAHPDSGQDNRNSKSNRNQSYKSFCGLM